MEQNKTCIEMAFELAKSGKFTDFHHLEDRLRDAGYATAQLDGPSLRRQIRALLATAAKTQATAARTSQPEQRPAQSAPNAKWS